VAFMITEDCINCGICERFCPGDGISKGDEVFVIDPDRCTECVGFHHNQQCARVCPIESCITDPSRVETEAVLFERAKQLHPELADSLELGPETSHFRAEERTVGTKLKRMGRRLSSAVRGPETPASDPLSAPAGEVNEA